MTRNEIESLQRYSFTIDTKIIEDQTGQWVKFEDVLQYCPTTDQDWYKNRIKFLEGRERGLIKLLEENRLSDEGLRDAIFKAGREDEAIPPSFEEIYLSDPRRVV
jgi:hypothetical protein